MNDPVLTGYNVHPSADRAEMLQMMGLKSVEELFSQVPSAIRLGRRLNLPEALTEWELQKRLRSLASSNATVRTHLSFLGAGSYEHYVPAAIHAIANRGEYLTAYTPYQPEMSQGLLRMLHDFQTIMGRLLGLPAVNSSVYDGATAFAEAAWMCCSIKDLRHLVVSDQIWPEWRIVLETYLRGRGVEISWVSSDPQTGETSASDAERLLRAKPAAGFLWQTPNRFGVIEPGRKFIELGHAHNALAQVSCYPILLGSLESPGKQGADLVCCEAQSLGLALNAGGPYLGIIATREEYKKYLPGRIVGDCVDLKGEPALALVMEEREQHVSRDKATSHICSNQALLALRATIFLSLMGEGGFQEMARLNAVKAHYFCDKLCSIPGVKRAKSGRFFNEFLLEIPSDPATTLTRLREKKIFGGVDFASLHPNYRSHLLISVTELKSKQELDLAADAFREVLTQPRSAQ
jgi:glycine dehydrogenase subunit 1